jgi:hypothetical protein
MARGGSALPRKALAQVKRLCENDPIRTRGLNARDTQEARSFWCTKHVL